MYYYRSEKMYSTPPISSLPLFTLWEGGPLEGVGPETYVYKTYNIHKLMYIKLPWASD
jgi:hypothetical protein